MTSPSRPGGRPSASMFGDSLLSRSDSALRAFFGTCTFTAKQSNIAAKRRKADLFKSMPTGATGARPVLIGYTHRALHVYCDAGGVHDATTQGTYTKTTFLLTKS